MRFRVLLLLWAVTASAPGQALAQTRLAEIGGTVSDQTGGPHESENGRERHVGRATAFAAVKNLLNDTYIVDRARGILLGSPRLVQIGVRTRF